MTQRSPATENALGPVVDTTPALRPKRATIEGRLVSLEPINAEKHSESLFEGSHGIGPNGEDKGELWRYMFHGPFPDRAAFHQHMREFSKSEDPFAFAIVDCLGGKAVGRAAYLRIEPDHRVIEVGHILYTPALRQTASATEAMYLMARHVFEDLGYRRYEWKCNSLNQASRRAAERLGFTFEGIFRQHMIIKGRSRDTAWFAMLDSDWPLCKAAFEAWLGPENFNAQHQQRRRLEEIRRDLAQAI